MSEGILYVAFGRTYLAMALNSAQSARSVSPDIDIHIITNVPVKAGMINRFFTGAEPTWLQLPMKDSENRNIKTDLFRLSPFEKTLFLDTDTVVLKNPAPLFEFLEHFDLCIRLRSQPQRQAGKAEHVIATGHQISELPHWNSGVIAFRNSSAAQRFFERWAASYKSMGVASDQVSLVEAIFLSDVRLLSLDDRWNRQSMMARDSDVGVLHYSPGLTESIEEGIRCWDRRIGNGMGGPSDVSSGTEAWIEGKRQKKRFRGGSRMKSVLRRLRSVLSG